MEQLKNVAAHQKERLNFYNSYNYLRAVSPERLAFFNSKHLDNWFTSQPNFHIFETIIEGQYFWFLYEFLPWDSNYFKVPTYRLFTVFYSEASFKHAVNASKKFKRHLQDKGKGYCFANIPAEDTFLIQVLTASKFGLIETRLNFYRDELQHFNYQRFPVRSATSADIPLLKKVAATCRNKFDRYHADVHFPEEQADAYLATYAEACVNGLSETVLVPDEKLLEPAAFLAISRLKKDASILNLNLAQITLTAVSPVCKGWHLKLVTETLQYAKTHGCDYVLMTTQATNRAVFRTSEKLGFKLGNTTHILAVKF